MVEAQICEVLAQKKISYITLDPITSNKKLVQGK
jgi:hypothetical protein